MSSSTEERIIAARQLDQASTALINLGVRTVKRNPIKVGSYVVGLLICLLFSGWKVNETQRQLYYNEMQKIDGAKINSVGEKLYHANRAYIRTKGWFTCDDRCQVHKRELDAYQKEYNILRAEEDRQMAQAKSQLGLFSEHGVEETRNLFWERFAQGKGFAQRQTKWDAIFFGISAMGRDETLISYIFRLVLSFLFNFTIGVFGAVVAFMFNLFSLIRSYQAGLLTGLMFFGFASLAAIAFAMTWIIGLYAATAGAVYVGAKLISANMRIEDAPGSRDYARRHRVT